jgi:alkanesulfonate monooxygenase SsuD/methylene tetrahydromethanopterin reductase-like flavin-dependent oxidoreductase (luciferase family)
LHDSVGLEDLGIPAVPVATEEFRTAARVQASRLGRSDMDAVFVPHPIQDQTRAEIEERADAVVDELVRRLTGAR